MKKWLLFSTLFIALQGKGIAQEKSLKDNYLGFMPSFLMEPYDTINAVEVNLFPFLYEFRTGERNHIAFQFRPILNYRFLKSQNGFSQTGGTVVLKKYLLNLFEDTFWMKPQLGIPYTYAYNRLDKIQTMTFGVEPGAYIEISEKFSCAIILQPGINYYPDKASQEYVKTDSGFKSHFGIFFHIGYNF